MYGLGWGAVSRTGSHRNYVGRIGSALGPTRSHRADRLHWITPYPSHRAGCRGRTVPLEHTVPVAPCRLQGHTVPIACSGCTGSHHTRRVPVVRGRAGSLRAAGTHRASCTGSHWVAPCRWNTPCRSHRVGYRVTPCRFQGHTVSVPGSHRAGRTGSHRASCTWVARVTLRRSHRGRTVSLTRTGSPCVALCRAVAHCRTVSHCAHWSYWVALCRLHWFALGRSGSHCVALCRIGLHC